MKPIAAKRNLDVCVHLRIPPAVLSVIKPAAESEGLRLASWIRRTIVLAATQRTKEQATVSQAT